MEGGFALSCDYDCYNTVRIQRVASHTKTGGKTLELVLGLAVLLDTLSKDELPPPLGQDFVHFKVLINLQKIFLSKISRYTVDISKLASNLHVQWRAFPTLRFLVGDTCMVLEPGVGGGTILSHDTIFGCSMFLNRNCLIKCMYRTIPSDCPLPEKYKAQY